MITVIIVVEPQRSQSGSKRWNGVSHLPFTRPSRLAGARLGPERLAAAPARGPKVARHAVVVSRLVVPRELPPSAAAGTSQ
jgi:hypothetical protein